MPPFLVLNFILAGHTDNHYNDFDDNSVLEPFLEVEGYNLELSCAVMASRMHFFAISKLFGSFYKFDDMIEDSLAAVPYSSFTEAYNEKSMKTVPPFHLNQKSVRPRKGAVYFVIYKGPEYDEEVEERWRKTLGKAECLDKVSNCKISDENDNSEPPPNKSKEMNGDNSDVFSETVQEATATEDLGETIYAENSKKRKNCDESNVREVENGIADENIVDGDSTIHDVFNQLGKEKVKAGGKIIEEVKESVSAVHEGKANDEDHGWRDIAGGKDVPGEFYDAQSEEDAASEYGSANEIDRDDSIEDEVESEEDRIESLEKHNSKCKID